MVLASRGLRDLDDGPAPYDDDEVERAVWRQALGVVGKSLAITLLLTTVLYIVP